MPVTVTIDIDDRDIDGGRITIVETDEGGALADDIVAKALARAKAAVLAVDE